MKPHIQNKKASIHTAIEGKVHNCVQTIHYTNCQENDSEFSEKENKKKDPEQEFVKPNKKFHRIHMKKNINPRFR